MAGSSKTMSFTWENRRHLFHTLRDLIKRSKSWRQNDFILPTHFLGLAPFMMHRRYGPYTSSSREDLHVIIGSFGNCLPSRFPKKPTLNLYESDGYHQNSLKDISHCQPLFHKSYFKNQHTMFPCNHTYLDLNRFPKKPKNILTVES